MHLVLLGRDGVINEISHTFVATPEEWHPIPGSIRAIARLSYAHYHVVVTTNQPALAGGELSVGACNRIHERLRREVANEGAKIDAIMFCPHGAEEKCTCRKPSPGMFREIAQRLNINLEAVPVIGDSLADVEAARAVGARPMLVRTGLGRLTEERGTGLAGVPVFDDLAAAVDALLRDADGEAPEDALP